MSVLFMFGLILVNEWNSLRKKKNLKVCVSLVIDTE